MRQSKREKLARKGWKIGTVQEFLLDKPTIAFFKDAAAAARIPYQTLINLYLRDCAQQGRKLSLEWRASA